jgi:hypothetical protein
MDYCLSALKCYGDSMYLRIKCESFTRLEEVIKILLSLGYRNTTLSFNMRKLFWKTGCSAIIVMPFWKLYTLTHPDIKYDTFTIDIKASN